MTNEEFEVLWEEIKAHDRREAEEFRKLPQKERERLSKEAENSRLWEDWTDVQPISGTDKKQSNH